MQDPDSQPETGDAVPTAQPCPGQWDLEDMIADVERRGLVAAPDDPDPGPALFGHPETSFAQKLTAALAGSFTAQFIAKQVGVTPTTVRGWTAGKRPHQATARRVMQVVEGEILAPESLGQSPAETAAGSSSVSRVDKSRAAMDERRVKYEAEVAPPWRPEGRSPDRPRTPGPEGLESDAERLRRHERLVLGGDISHSVFGRAAPDDVVPFDDPVNKLGVPDDLLHLRRLSRLDYKASLAGRERLLWFSGARPHGGGRTRIARNVPSNVNHEVMV